RWRRSGWTRGGWWSTCGRGLREVGLRAGWVRIERRVWVGETLPPRRSIRESASHPPATRVRELRGKTGRGRSRRVAAPTANVPTRSQPAFPPPGRGGEAGRPPGRKGGGRGIPNPHPQFSGDRKSVEEGESVTTGCV